MNNICTTPLILLNLLLLLAAFEDDDDDDDRTLLKTPLRGFSVINANYVKNLN